MTNINKNIISQSWVESEYQNEMIQDVMKENDVSFTINCESHCYTTD